VWICSCVLDRSRKYSGGRNEPRSGPVIIAGDRVVAVAPHALLAVLAALAALAAVVRSQDMLLMGHTRRLCSASASRRIVAASMDRHHRHKFAQQAAFEVGRSKQPNIYSSSSRIPRSIRSAELDGQGYLKARGKGT